MIYYYNFGLNPYSHKQKKKIAKIQYIKIQFDSNNKFKSLKFIYFLLLIDKLIVLNNLPLLF